MNAITVNYAEIDSNSVPRSFGLAYTSLLTNGGFFVDGISHIFNASVKELIGTPYSLVQGRNFDYDKGIIVTTASPSSTSLNALRGVKNQTWINFYQPTWDNDDFIWLDYNPETGKFYTMVEKDTFPNEKELGYSVQVSRVLENENGCYTQVALTTKAALTPTATADTVTVKYGNLPIVSLNSSLTAFVENANTDDFTTISNITDGYQVPNYDYINPDVATWVHEGTDVTPGIALVSNSGLVKKYVETTNGNEHLYRILTGNNEVTLYRKRKDLIVNFTFDGDTSKFGDVGASCNGIDSAEMPSDNQLKIPEAKYGRTNINIRQYFNNLPATALFSINTIDIYTGQSLNVVATLTLGSTTDYIIYTGCTKDGFVNGSSYAMAHSSLPKTYTLNAMTTSDLSGVDVRENDGLLNWSSGNNFVRHQQLLEEYQERSVSNSGPENWRTMSSRLYIDDSHDYVVEYSWDSKEYGGFLWWGKKSANTKRYVRKAAGSNFASQYFYVTASYSKIPDDAIVEVTTPNGTAAASSKVVLFRGKYYVADGAMAELVARLVPGVTVTARKDWSEDEDVPWSAQFVQNFWYVKPITKEVASTSQTSAHEAGSQVTQQTETVFDYYEYGQQYSATITIYGIGSTVTGIASSSEHVSVQLRQGVSIESRTFILNVPYTCSVSAATEEYEGYSLVHNTSVTGTVNPTANVPNGTWNNKIKRTYKFFNN